MTSDPQDLGAPDLANRAWDPFWEVVRRAAQLPVHFHIGASVTGMTFYGQVPVGLARRQHQARHRRHAALHRQRPRRDQPDPVGDLRPPSGPQDGLGRERRRLDPLHPRGARLRDVGERPAGARRHGARCPPSTSRATCTRRSGSRTTGTSCPDLIDAVGEDNILFETDFPHPTCLYPNPLQTRGGEDGDALAGGAAARSSARMPASSTDSETPSGAGMDADRALGRGATPSPGTSGRTAPVYDPAPGVQTAEVALASAAEVDAAVQAAVEAWHAWGVVVADQAGRLAVPTARAARRQPRRPRGGRDPRARQGARTMRGARSRAGSRTSSSPAASRTSSRARPTRRSRRGSTSAPCSSRSGVVAGITPFNFPVMVPLWMMANAIACGNCFVLKPSEKDPSASLLLAEIVQRGRLPRRRGQRRAGRPRGGGRAAGPPRRGRRLLRRQHPGGARTSTRRGRGNGKRVQALGGAKNHMVVLPDADLDAAADAAVSAAYGSAGERCMAISVVVAVGAVADRLVDAIATRIPDVVVGAGRRPGVHDGAADHRGAPRPRAVLRRGRGRRGSHGGRRRVGRHRAGRGSSSAAPCSTT